MNDSLLLDAHLHIKAHSELHIAENVGCILLNSTELSDMYTVKNSADIDNRIVPFFGIHPWNAVIAEMDLPALPQLLAKNAYAGIGECGLDFGQAYRKTRTAQIGVFEKQLELAFEFRRPFSVHCVRAWGQIIKSLGKFVPLPSPFILHSFYGSSETAEILINLGGYISISPISLQNPVRSTPVIKDLPLNRILTETDLLAGGKDFSAENHLHTLKNVYNTVANIKSTGFNDFLKRIWENGTVFTNSETDRN